MVDDSELMSAVDSHDVDKVRDLFDQNPDLLDEIGWWVHRAAGFDDVDMVQMMTEELGADINIGRYSADPRPPITTAAREAAVKTVSYLLSKGAHVNTFIGDLGSPLEAASAGGNRDIVCMLLEHGADVNIHNSVHMPPVAAAATEGHYEIVQLLLDAGADPNICFGTTKYGDPLQNALSQAIDFGHPKVESLLQQRGARLPSQIPLNDELHASVLQHFRNHLGVPRELALHELLPAEIPVSVHVIDLGWSTALFTSGMSSFPASDSQGQQIYAELVVYLPKSWPLDEKSVNNPIHSWPIEWLLEIAKYPADNPSCLLGPVAIFTNGEPPQPFASNTDLSCIMAVSEESDFGSFEVNGRHIEVFTLFPLYREERDLEKTEGAARILRLFHEYKLGREIIVDRPNVAGKT